MESEGHEDQKLRSRLENTSDKTRREISARHRKGNECDKRNCLPLCGPDLRRGAEVKLTSLLLIN